jgi:hypothetical protein
VALAEPLAGAEGAGCLRTHRCPHQPQIRPHRHRSPAVSNSGDYCTISISSNRTRHRACVRFGFWPLSRGTTRFWVKFWSQTSHFSTNFPSLDSFYPKKAGVRMFGKSFAVTQDTAVRTDRNGTVLYISRDLATPQVNKSKRLNFRELVLTQF